MVMVSMFMRMIVMVVMFVVIMVMMVVLVFMVIVVMVMVVMMVLVLMIVMMMVMRVRLVFLFPVYGHSHVRTGDAAGLSRFGCHLHTVQTQFLHFLQKCGLIVQ